MKDLLKKICGNKRSEIEKSKERCSFNSLEKILKDKTNRNFKELLIESQRKMKTNLIAEIKKRSPSAGLIIDDYYPEIIAAQYEKSGAGAISILTDNNFFEGELEHLSLLNKKICNIFF